MKKRKHAATRCDQKNRWFLNELLQKRDGLVS